MEWDKLLFVSQLALSVKAQLNIAAGKVKATGACLGLMLFYSCCFISLYGVFFFAEHAYSDESRRTRWRG